MLAGEIEHRQHDEDGNRLRQHAIAHQPVRPFVRHRSAERHHEKSGKQNGEHHREREDDEDLAHQVAGLGAGEGKGAAGGGKLWRV